MSKPRLPIEFGCTSHEAPVERFHKIAIDIDSGLYVEGVCSVDGHLVGITLTPAEVNQLRRHVREYFRKWQDEQVQKFRSQLDQAGVWDELDSDEDGP